MAKCNECIHQDVCYKVKLVDEIKTYVCGDELTEADLQRPQGECKTCRHRDPEDKKCDCGGLERQGCKFPVSDDYFCRFYEKGGKEK